MTAADDSRAAAPRRAPLQPRLLLLVFAGGCLGTAAREGIALSLPVPSGLPWAVLLVNLVGAFALGLLIGGLAARGTETPRRRDVRLFAGTGVLGGFTTYSALATDTVLLVETDPLWGAAYALGSVAGGVALAGLGMLVARRAIPGAESRS
jgi:CrcB protein